MNNAVNQIPFLRTSREFPEDPKDLTVQINKSYIDTATAVNDRTIGIYPTIRPAITGDGYFLTNKKKQQTLRQVYPFTSVGPIPHGIINIIGFVKIYGTFTDGTIWYPLPYVDVVSATNQVKITVDSTNINITAGAGAPPSITQGYCILEWLSDP